VSLHHLRLICSAPSTSIVGRAEVDPDVPPPRKFSDRLPTAFVFLLGGSIKAFHTAASPGVNFDRRDGLALTPRGA
jgi:hypothetical protein